MKLLRILLNYFFILPIILQYGCSYDKRELPEPVHPHDTVLIVTCDTTPAVTYTGFVKSILETNCTAFSNCHGTDAPEGFDYTAYAGIKAKVDSGTFQKRVLVLRDMPQPGSPGPDTLDDCTLLKLQKWVNNGAPE